MIGRAVVVAPHVGAWIETSAGGLTATLALVAPHVGAWIETLVGGLLQNNAKSRPTWARGLKRDLACVVLISVLVAPHVGAWIETVYLGGKTQNVGRAPRGRVD